MSSVSKILPCSALMLDAQIRSMSNKKSDLNDSGLHRDALTSDPIPEPLPAVAFDFWDEEDEVHDLVSSPVVHQNNGVTRRSYGSNIRVKTWEPIRGSSAGGRITNTPPPSSSPSGSASFEGKSLPSRKSAGGGGSDGGNGRHRCPKCGTSVTFRHGDFEENTYYCATCSGWFLIDTNATSDGSKHQTGGGLAYQGFLPKNGSDGAPKQPQDPQILMHHVSDHSLVVVNESPIILRQNFLTISSLYYFH